ncbi:MAG: transposase, partial [Planctomycetes bacterium]|nr:transposase [Planctomycetota bacterium]
DQNDHDALRSDPVFKLIAGRSPDDEDLASQPTLSRFENSVSVRSPDVEPPSPLPTRALAGRDRRRYFNRRRQRDPLGEGHPCTWRTRLIKVAAEITVSCRRVLVRLSGNWPYLNHYRHVSERALALCSAPLRPG